MAIVHNILVIIQVLLFLSLIFLIGYGARLWEESERDLKRAIKVRNEAEASLARARRERESQSKEIEKTHVNTTV